jgi:hypothetical protein
MCLEADNRFPVKAMGNISVSSFRSGKLLSEKESWLLVTKRRCRSMEWDKNGRKRKVELKWNMQALLKKQEVFLLLLGP